MLDPAAFGFSKGAHDWITDDGIFPHRKAFPRMHKHMFTSHSLGAVGTVTESEGSPDAAPAPGFQIGVELPEGGEEVEGGGGGGVQTGESLSSPDHEDLSALRLSTLSLHVAPDLDGERAFCSPVAPGMC